MKKLFGKIRDYKGLIGDSEPTTSLPNSLPTPAPNPESSLIPTPTPAPPCIKFPFYRDCDGDLRGDLATKIIQCAQPPGYVLYPFDCNDKDPNVHVGAPEIIYDGIDNNCNGAIDEIPACDLHSPLNWCYEGRTRSDRELDDVAVSKDGSTIASIYTSNEDCTAQSSNPSRPVSGCPSFVRVFDTSSNSQIGMDIEGFFLSPYDGRQRHLDISADGTVVMVQDLGGLYAYKLNARGIWQHMGDIIRSVREGKPYCDGYPNTGIYSFHLSGNGNEVVIGYPFQCVIHDHPLDGPEREFYGEQAGTVQVFQFSRRSNSWDLTDDIPGEFGGDRFGSAVSLSENV